MPFALFANITFAHDKGGAVPIAPTLASEMSEITGIAWDYSGDMVSAWLGLDSAVEWPGHEADLAAFSRHYPDLRITADFEDNTGERWRIYAMAGQTQNEHGRIVFDDCTLWGAPFDVAANHPILSDPGAMRTLP